MKILTISTVLSGIVIGILLMPIAGTLVGLVNFWASKEFQEIEGERFSLQIENKVSLPGTSLKLLKKSSSEGDKSSSTYELEFQALKVSPQLEDTNDLRVDINHISTLTDDPESVYEMDHTKFNNEGILLIKIKNETSLNYILIGFTFVTLILLSIYGYGLYLLSRLYKNVSRSEIFSKENQKILITLACIAFGIFFWELAFDNYLRNNIMDSFFPTEGYYKYLVHFNFEGLLAGSILLLKAGIISKGREIKAENDLTV